jgi:hypothetical protein
MSLIAKESILQVDGMKMMMTRNRVVMAPTAVELRGTVMEMRIL